MTILWTARDQRWRDHLFHLISAKTFSLVCSGRPLSSCVEGGLPLFQKGDI